MPTAEERIIISERAIRRAARHHGQGYNLPVIVVRQAFAEAWVRAIKRARFRRAAAEGSLEGYSAMSAGEFSGVNARQRWANWRTIPRNLHLACPSRPVMAIDLCSGTGDSTQVLAWHLPPGSRILGLEFQASFVARARARRYTDASAREAEVEFSAQSVLETFRDASGAPVPASTVDVVNSSGAVACHFTPAATAELAREIARVLAPTGVALIDAGADGTPPRALEGIFAALGFRPMRAVRSCWLDRAVQIAFTRG